MRMTKETTESLSLEDLAMEFDHRIDCGDGELVQWGTVNNAKLRAKVREVNATGMKAMAPYVKWLIERDGVNPRTAKLTALIAWRALLENHEDPSATLFEPNRYSHYQRLSVRRALSRFATWMIETTNNSNDLEYAKKLSNRLAAVPHQNKPRNTERKLSPGVPTTVMTEEEVDRLFQAIETRHANGGGSRNPWARAILRLMMLTGHIGRENLFFITRDSIVEAVEKHEAGGTAAVPIWGKLLKANLIPVALAYEEFKYLAEWPWPWGILGDLIIPNSKNVTQSAVEKARRELQATFETAGIPQEKHITRRLNRTMIKRIWDSHNDYFLMQSMFGWNIQRTKSLTYLAIPIATF